MRFTVEIHGWSVLNEDWRPEVPGIERSRSTAGKPQLRIRAQERRWVVILPLAGGHNYPAQPLVMFLLLRT
jgi:hypothetical protein